MDSIIDYDTVKTLVANPPRIDPCPNFFNLRALQTHFTYTLTCLPCPQSTVNKWLGAVMSKEMYALVDSTPFKPGQSQNRMYQNFPRSTKLKASPKSPILASKPSIQFNSINHYATTRAYCVWGGKGCESFPTQKTHWTLVSIRRIVFVIFS